MSKSSRAIQGEREREREEERKKKNSENNAKVSPKSLKTKLGTNEQSKGCEAESKVELVLIKSAFNTSCY